MGKEGSKNRFGLLAGQSEERKRINPRDREFCFKAGRGGSKMSRKEKGRAPCQQGAMPGQNNTSYDGEHNKAFDVPDTFKSCFGMYFSADSIGVCPECEYGYRCYIMSMGR